MKTVDIITRDMHQLHGANRVTEKLIFGAPEFRKHGFRLRYVISQDGVLACKNYQESTLGVQLQTGRYQLKRKVIESLKKLPVYKLAYFQTKIISKEIDQNEPVLRRLGKIRQMADIVIFQDPFTAIYCLRHGFKPKKSIFISHAEADPLEQLLLNRPSLKGTKTERYLRDEMAFLFYHVDRVVTICESARKYMKETYGLECPCIRNGIEDIDDLTARKYSQEDHRVHLAIVASLQYRKGQDLAIAALSRLTESERERICLHLIGDGNYRQNLEEITREKHLEKEVCFHGALLDVKEELLRMDAFLLPSRADTVPISIIEAMRAGLPVFASEVGEIPYMIRGCGELIRPQEESIADLYSRLAAGRIDLQSYAEQSRERFLKEFRLSSMIHRYAEVLDGLD